MWEFRRGESHNRNNLGVVSHEENVDGSNSTIYDWTI